MCGILGQISNLTINQDLFTSDLLKLKHRGPDDYGTYFDNTIAAQVLFSVLILEPITMLVCEYDFKENKTNNVIRIFFIK